uniref:Uncharacterized protein n=1 Tax=viral metagenome TaxID=1070528 RepID=A0A6C0E5K6_9ZZZZ
MDTNTINSSFSNTPPSINNFTNNPTASIDWKTTLIVIVVLGLLGFNIFVYLANGSEGLLNIIRPITKKLVYLFGLVTGTIIHDTAGGTKEIVGTTASVIDKGLDSVQTITKKTLQSDVIQPPDILKSSTFNKALNTASQNSAHDKDYQADDSDSQIQNKASRSGWCFIGEDRNVRSCAEVGANDMCMSGDIFPSREICVNPTLRP